VRTPEQQQAIEAAAAHYESLPVDRKGEMKVYMTKKFKVYELEAIDQSIDSVIEFIAQRDAQLEPAVIAPVKTMTPFQQRAKLLLDRNIPVVMVTEGKKNAFETGWQNKLITSLDDARFSNPSFANCNTGAVAQAKIGGFWILEIDSPEVVAKIETDTGHSLKKVPTLVVCSRENRWHIYFQQNEASIKMGNIPQKYGAFSARVNSEYVVGPKSHRDDINADYTTGADNKIPVAPDWLIQWLESQRKKAGTNTETKRYERELIKQGFIHPWLVTECGKLRSAGATIEEMEPIILRRVHAECQGPIDEGKVRQVVRSFDKYDPGRNTDVFPGQKPDTQQQSEISTLFNPSAVTSVRGDMSDAVLSGRLGEICQRRMLKDFPIAYAWPSICAAAGVSVPQVPSEASILTHSEAMTTSYTGLVGAIHSGKSQAIGWARKVVGIPDGFHSEVKPASAESLLLKLSYKRNKGLLGDSVLIDLDEWGHLFSKAKIENSSFSTFLQSAFYKRHHEQTMGNGKDVNFDCAISIVGGIVEDQFDLCFGANTMGGLHDRFTFGLCPAGYNFMYREFEGQAEKLSPIPVRIAPEIWEMVAAIRKENPGIGREAEIAIRVAHICAAYDGRAILQTADCESMVKAFIAEQCKIRLLLKPNAGITIDAQCANALVQWLERNTPNGEIAWERDVRFGLRKTLERLGPGVLEYCTKNLSLQGVIWYGEIANAKMYKGRKPRAYSLITPAALEFDTQG
jgi:Bifunctional DNA primase/polymerase, N-terminal